jgi:hypothetical protein
MMSNTGNSNTVRPTILSGGQTGVDRAALDTALALHLPCGGWCPRGRRAEDGPLPARYPLFETDSPDYPPRTERNVRDADATLILNRGPLAGGTAYTVRMAETLGKPCLVKDLDAADPTAIVTWLRAQRVNKLNIAGPRESSRPGIYAQASALLQDVLAAWSSSR